MPMFRFTIRDVLWLTVVVGLGVGWFYHAWGLWIGKARAEDEMRALNQALAECRQRLAEANP
jgi:hypothetical protein